MVRPGLKNPIQKSSLTGFCHGNHSHILAFGTVPPRGWILSPSPQTVERSRDTAQIPEERLCGSRTLPVLWRSAPPASRQGLHRAGCSLPETYPSDVSLGPGAKGPSYLSPEAERSMTSQAPGNGPVVSDMVASRQAAPLSGKAHEDRGPHGSCCPV